MEINKRNGWVSARGKRSLGTKGFQDYFVEIPESVAKESLQNAIDAALNLQDTTKTLLEYKDSDTVFSKIQVIELTNAAKKEWLEERIMCDEWGRPPSLADVPLTIMTRKEALIKQGGNEKTIDKLYKETINVKKEK